MSELTTDEVNDRKLNRLKKAADQANCIAGSIAAEAKKKINEAQANGQELPFSVNDLKSFSAALKNLASFTRDVYDIPTSAENQKQTIERLKFEDAGEDGETRLILSGATQEEADEWSG